MKYRSRYEFPLVYKEIGDNLIGGHFLPQPLTGDFYRHAFHEDLPVLL